jgi:hypothetical protein
LSDHSTGDGEGRGVEVGGLASAAGKRVHYLHGAEHADFGGEGLARLDVPQLGGVGLNDEVIPVGVNGDQGSVLDRGDCIAIDVVLGNGARDCEGYSAGRVKVQGYYG